MVFGVTASGQPAEPPSSPPTEPAPPAAIAPPPAPRPASSPAAKPASPATPAPATPADRAATPPLDPPDEELEVFEEAAETQITLRDGRRMVGVISKVTKEAITLRVGGIQTPVPMEDVDSVETLPTVEERYAQMRDAIDPADVERRLQLAEWLVARNRYGLALREINGVLRVSPKDPQATRLKVQVEQQRVLYRESRERAKPAAAGEDGAPAGPATRAGFPTLSLDEVNLIRVFQVDLDDPPRMNVPRSLIDDLIKQYGDRPEMPTTAEGRNALYRKQPVQILRLVFELKARDLYGRIKVLDEPRPMKLFRESIARGWLVNSCSTTKCHGGSEAGRLYLNNRRTNADATIYTNFLILHEFKLADGTWLIDYARPADSPLLQMALPEGESKRPHPRVESVGRQTGFEPVFRTAEDRRFQEAVEWIKSMHEPEGRSYPIDYVPPAPPDPEATAAKPGEKPDAGEKKPDRPRGPSR